MCRYPEWLICLITAVSVLSIQLLIFGCYHCLKYIKNPPNKNNVSSCAYADSAIEVSKKRRDHTSFKYSFLTYLFRKKSRQVGR